MIRERRERAKLDATPPWQQKVREDVATTGPFDEKDAPEDGLARVDLGALRIPIADGQELRVDVNEQREIAGVTIVGAGGEMQLGLYAAPRNEGIWDEIRADIAGSMRAQKSQPSERPDGPFGVELVGKLPDPSGQPTPVRFIGVDGPRWFLRAMLAGPAAGDPAQAAIFEQTLRGTIVSRGNSPLPVREAVALTMPKEIVLPDAE